MKIPSLRRGTFAVSLLAIVVAGGMAIASASATTARVASTVTLHFFSKTASFTATDAAGNPVSLGSAPPAVGDVLDFTDLNYVGNHKHHAKQWTASDHLRCVVKSVPSAAGAITAVCDGQIAIRGSMLLADHVTSTITQFGTSVPINGGTGEFHGYHGTATSKGIGNSNNSDFTVVVHR